MKRFWFAPALVAICSSANAQSAVTMYGVMDLYVESAKNGDATLNRVSSGGLYGSRWGVRGTEDLGGGNSALFALEAGINANTGAAGQGGLAFGRQSFVGLSGRAGQILLGRQYAPIYFTQLASDADGYSTFSIPGALGAYNAATLRQDNMVKYVLPRIADILDGQISYAFGNVPGHSSAGRKLGAHFAVNAGPATLVAGYNNDNVKSTTVDSRRTYAFGGKLPIAWAEFTANFYTDSTEATAGTTIKLKGWSVGATKQFGNVSALVQVGRTTSNRFPDATETAWLLGANYYLSKRTDIYLRLAKVRDKNNATDASWYGLGDVPANNSNRTFNVGIRHKF